MSPNDSRVLRAIGYLQPCPDRAVEQLCWSLFKTPPSTVRGTRKRLQLRGVVREAGRYRDGVMKWELAK
jgi:hypothetical protein